MYRFSIAGEVLRKESKRLITLGLVNDSLFLTINSKKVALSISLRFPPTLISILVSSCLVNPVVKLTIFAFSRSFNVTLPEASRVLA